MKASEEVFTFLEAFGYSIRVGERMEWNFSFFPKKESYKSSINEDKKFLLKNNDTLYKEVIKMITQERIFHKNILIGIIFAVLIFSSTGFSQTASPPTTFYYPDVILNNWGTGNAPQIWDLTACDLTLYYTINMSQITTPGWAVTEIGLRQLGAPNIDPNLQGGWMQSNYISGLSNPSSRNNNDFHLLSKHGWLYQTYDAQDPYTLITTPYWSNDNHGFWFDRDGVDQWQANLWGANGTYNTGGIYPVVISYHALDEGAATMFATINGVQQGLYNGGWKNSQPEFYPAGRSFVGVMEQMQLFWGRGGGGGPVTISDITITGCFVLSEGMATGGGWFIPEPDKAEGLTTLGGKATFGFVAKQKDGKSSGQLEFQYHADRLSLKSTEYNWVTLAATQVMFEGTGTINDYGAYKFRVRAVDGNLLGGGAQDRFEIRIWTGNSDNWDSPTYRAEGNLGGGQIVVHKK